MNRRNALVIIGGSAATGPLANAQQHQHAPAGAAAAASPQAPRFLSAPHLALVDRLSEMIIPADAHSPGAHEAKVAAYIDEMLAEASPQTKADWTRGLEAIDAEAKARRGKLFVDCAAAEQDRIMKAMADGEESPKTELHRIFVKLKSQTLSGYYTSSIGLLKDLQYKGNVPLAAFPPCNHPDHQKPAASAAPKRKQ